VFLATAAVRGKEEQMAIRVYDYRTDIANLVVHPEIRGRFMQMEPAPAGRMHSHDLGGEIFLVLAGHCEFLVEDERVTCGPGQLIYVEPRRKHTLHAVGAAPCTVYLSVTPHVEPTHTQYDEAEQELPPRYGTWRGLDHGDADPAATAAQLATRYADAAHRLADLARAHAEDTDQHLHARTTATTTDNRPSLKGDVDAIWRSLRDLLQQVSTLERDWNALVPRSMPER
jgi:quercetin dioxygenase-like cupin family protein